MLCRVVRRNLSRIWVSRSGGGECSRPIGVDDRNVASAALLAAALLDVALLYVALLKLALRIRAGLKGLELHQYGRGHHQK